MLYSIYREQLRYEVAIKHKRGDPELRKPLLEDVNGFVKPGAMLALMVGLSAMQPVIYKCSLFNRLYLQGSSGAGKTTLLNLISQRLRGGFVTGTVLL